MRDLFKLRPESHVNDTPESGSFREAGRPEPKVPGELGSVVEMEAYQAKVRTEVLQRLQEMAKEGWRPSDILGNDKQQARLVHDLNRPFNSVMSALKEIAREEAAKRRPTSHLG